MKEEDPTETGVVAVVKEKEEVGNTKKRVQERAEAAKTGEDDYN